MASKRKAGPSASDRPSKRTVSQVGTPISLDDSDDDYDSNGEDDSDLVGERPNYEEAIDHFQIKAAAPRTGGGDAASHLFRPNHDWATEPLKPDHHLRPLWIDPLNGKVVLETFAPTFKQAQNFLINIAEPQSRTAHMHEYTISPNSLFAAVSVGLTEQDIINQLELHSKTKVPDVIKSFVHDVTQAFGKVRLVLKHNKYFIECTDASVLQRLLRDPVISSCRVDEEVSTGKAAKKGDLEIGRSAEAARLAELAQAEQRAKVVKEDEDSDDEFGGREAEQDLKQFIAEEEEEEDVDQVHSFQIDGDKLQLVQRHCNIDIALPLTEEYDFRADDANANLDIDLRPNVQIRYYQEHALSKMFGNGRARSGIIVLPCGAGKTLVGITAACTIKKSVIVLCTSAMSAVQWKEEFKKWSNIDPDDIAVFTSSEKQKLNQKAGVIICTYSMVTQNTRRAHDSKKVMDSIMEREWGLMVLDEVHVVPAEMFRRVTERIKTHSKLGLTATLLREDDKIKDLNFLIGPKLYEANWLQLSEEGHIARVQCAEVWCPMTTEFYSEYLKTTNVNRRGLLATMNPRKYQACQYLIDFHERRGDKIIVFSDNVYALKAYAIGIDRPMIHGGTSNAEREQCLQNFQRNDKVRTIFLSKIGDTSLDLPEATCLIQISSHYGSRRQEAQRLGRILRAKRRNDEGFNAFFYSLVSKDTNEMFYSTKRQAFLVDQGYAFKVITNLAGMQSMPGLHYTTQQSRLDCLTDVLLQSEDKLGVEDIKDDLFNDGGSNRMKHKGTRRQAGTLSGLSGADNMAFIAAARNDKRLKDLKNKQNRNSFFKKEDARKEKSKKLKRAEMGD